MNTYLLPSTVNNFVWLFHLTLRRTLKGILLLTAVVGTKGLSNGAWFAQGEWQSWWEVEQTMVGARQVICSCVVGCRTVQSLWNQTDVGSNPSPATPSPWGFERVSKLLWASPYSSVTEIGVEHPSSTNLKFRVVHSPKPFESDITPQAEDSSPELMIFARTKWGCAWGSVAFLTLMGKSMAPTRGCWALCRPFQDTRVETAQAVEWSDLDSAPALCHLQPESLWANHLAPGLFVSSFRCMRWW